MSTLPSNRTESKLQPSQEQHSDYISVYSIRPSGLEQKGPSSAYDLSPEGLEKSVAGLFEQLITINGEPVKAQVVGGIGDGGIDIKLWNPQRALVGIVQVKRYRPHAFIPPTHLRDFAWVRLHSGVDISYFVTTAKFSYESRRNAQEWNIKLIDGQLLENMRAQIRHQAPLSEPVSQLQVQPKHYRRITYPVLRRQARTTTLIALLTGFIAVIACCVLSGIAGIWTVSVPNSSVLPYTGPEYANVSLGTPETAVVSIADTQDSKVVTTVLTVGYEDTIYRTLAANQSLPKISAVEISSVNPNEPTLTISYTTRQSTQAGYNDEWILFASALAPIVKTENLNIVTLFLAFGSPTQPIGVFSSTVDNAIAFADKKLTRAQFLNLAHFTPTNATAIPKAK